MRCLDVGDGTYLCSYTCTAAGEHRLTASIDAKACGGGAGTRTRRGFAIEKEEGVAWNDAGRVGGGAGGSEALVVRVTEHVF